MIFPGGNVVGRNVIIFGVDMSSSPHIDNQKKGILILGKRFYTRFRTYINCRENAFN